MRAFSIIELSIVLLIIGLTTGSIFKILNNNYYNNQLEYEQEKISTIIDSINNFIIDNGRLPCPAPSNLTDKDEDFGYELLINSSCDVTSLINDNNIILGSVPVRTLGIKDNNSFDNFGRKYSYIIDLRASIEFSQDCKTSYNCFKLYTEDENSIIINDKNNNLKKRASLLIISHGENGHGAYIKNSNFLVSSSGNIFEIENSHISESGVNLSYNNIFIDSSINKIGDFDDTLYPLTKAEITGSIKFYDDINCDISLNKDVICNNANNEDSCKSIADEISNYCY